MSDPLSQEPTSRFLVDNYFNYFTEIEDHFQRRRGGILLLSTLDWALIETWKDAGIPLEAALRGVDSAFDKYDQRPSKTRKVNSLAYCAQEVLAAAEDMKEAVVGSVREPGGNRGFDPAEIAAFLRKSASGLESARLPSRPGISPGKSLKRRLELWKTWRRRLRRQSRNLKTWSEG